MSMQTNRIIHQWEYKNGKVIMETGEVFKEDTFLPYDQTLTLLSICMKKTRTIYDKNLDTVTA